MSVTCTLIPPARFLLQTPKLVDLRLKGAPFVKESVSVGKRLVALPFDIVEFRAKFLIAFRDGFGLWIFELCSELFFLLLAVDGGLLWLEAFDDAAKATGVGDSMSGALLVAELEFSKLHLMLKSAV